jgi:uncharacterized protein (UPF0335 family)
VRACQHRNAPEAGEVMADDINQAKLMSYIERIEHIEEEKKGLAEDLKTLKEEIKENGMEPKYVTYVVKIRQQDREERMIDEANKEAYRVAAGVD